jgi:hypothetical protein
MYQAQRPSEWQFILADCGARVAICTNEPTYEVLDGMRGRLPGLRNLIGVARPDGAPGSWSVLRAIGATRPVEALSVVALHVLPLFGPSNPQVSALIGAA